ncbi:GntR family transcriptional regulator [Kineococcus gypseus]|uniref:GntR family transcriptional regulator n=1 Tax=Kineococcus gypseus TaxID=1637102 RepID=UPI003D7D7A0A
MVHEVVRQRIINLQYPPGTPLSENELAATLGVSRTPVRESLILLVGEGLVNVVPQVGTFVAPMREADIATAQFVREALELASLDQAVPRLTDEDVEDLRSGLAAQRRAAARSDQNRFFVLDEEFHLRLMAVSGHASAWRSVSQAKAHLDRARRLSLPLPDQLDVLIDQHEEVVDAMAARDVDRGIEALRKHLRKVFDDIAVIRAQHPQFFADA